ncbi:helix-turn-helix domain-containing protein [Mycobacterium sp. MYCO198283]|uniref:helix-turn-helix domain-containing protein n=1 Tax=Mycobacterium sp. MYCO198283 TaxID=2883505 RepID=UPI001E2EE1F8|nr:helix-turn-helix domain-containing protein [Mycobacterium sp. MYCO198283]MCG5432439.1 helix-turn-helix domain-containing protein [Mycobacterium sp. MYCO198283]
MQANGDLDQRVRRRLRALRSDRGLTLDEVSRRAGIDVSTLSRLESGKRRLALDHLPRLAEALSVTIDDLLRAPDQPDPRVRGSAFRHNQITFWPLTREGSATGLQAFKIRISPQRRTPPAELPVHDGREWMYVLSGRLRLLLGDAEFVVEPGQAAEFSTWTPHWFGAVEAVAIFGAHGERVHVRTGDVQD